MNREHDDFSEHKEGAGTSHRKYKGETGSAERPQKQLTLHQERQLRTKRRRRRMIVMIIAEVFTLAAIFGYGYFLRRWNQIQRPEFNEVAIKNNDLDMDTVERMKGYWTIACFGVDARDNETILKDTNADVNIVCNINMDTGDIKLVSVYRDSYLNISEKGSYNKINQAYFVGGPQQAVAALNRNLDLNITDYVTFNWKAVADAINILGGVDVEISKAEFYYINSFITETVKATGVGSHQLTSAGMNHLDGVQAVAYGRLRLMDTDYARTERQRKVIQLAFEKAKKADFDTLNRVLGTVFPQVATSIGVNDLFNCLKIISRFNLSETTGFPQARGSMMMGKKGDCVIPQTLESNVVKLHEFLFGEENYQPSASVKKISQKIAADSGMYKEGKYVDSVGTDGGVIQSAKAKKTAEAASSAAQSDEKYAVIYVLDEDGKKVKKSVVMETDEDGDYIEPETDADGLASGWSLNEDGKLVSRGTDASGETVAKDSLSKTKETDENGEPVEEEEQSGTLSPMETEEDGRVKETESSSGLRPGFLDETETENGTGSSVSAGPGASSTEAESSSASTTPTAANSTGTAPGGSLTQESTAQSGTSSAPGSSTASTTAANQTSLSPGETVSAPTSADLSDGTTNSPAPTSAASGGTGTGPGSSTQTILNSEAPTAATTAGPGQ